MTLPLQAMSTVRLNEADRHLEALALHLGEHGIVSERIGRDVRFSMPDAVANLSLTARGLHIAAEADDDEALASVKYLLASHLGEMAREKAPEFWWEGDGEMLATLPNFRLLTVKAAHDITPHMRRVTLAGDRLDRFDTLAALHGKLMIPAESNSVVWPELAPNGLVDWGPEERRPYIRKYTIRRVNAARGEIEIDFMLHGDGGPGVRFAERAAAGDMVGLMGPGGGSAPAAAFNLFVGDDTALPAIARLLESLPTGTRAQAFIEVETPDDVQPLATQADFDVAWMFRSQPSDTLANMAEKFAWPDEDNLFAWAGTEFSTFKCLRADWRTKRRLPKERHLAVSYWRAGLHQS